VDHLNKKAQQARLKLDNYECQLSRLFGIAALSGKPCSAELQIHHISYERCGHEPIGDLITVCTRCHDVLTDAIRRERYSVNLTQHGEGIAGQCPDSGQEGKKNVRKIELQDCPEMAKGNQQSVALGIVIVFGSPCHAAPRTAMPCPVKPGPVLPHLVNEL